jgi:hypothetical protein
MGIAHFNQTGPFGMFGHIHINRDRAHFIQLTARGTHGAIPYIWVFHGHNGFQAPHASPRKILRGLYGGRVRTLVDHHQLARRELLDHYDCPNSGFFQVVFEYQIIEIGAM